MSMLQKIITSGTTLTYPSMWYHQDTNWSAKAVTTAADRYTLVSPDAIQVDVGGVSLTQYSKQMLDLSLDTNWDFGQNIGTWTAEHTYAVGDLVRPQAATIADGSKNNNTAYATGVANANVMANGVTISADSVYDTQYAWKGFNQSIGGGDNWGPNNSGFPHWLKYDFGIGKSTVINKFKFHSSNTYSPKTFTLDGSNNNTDWTTLYTGTNVADPVSNWTPYFTFSNSTAYRYYRLHITVGWSAEWIVLNELHLVSQPSLIFRASAITTGVSNSTEPSWAVTGDTTDSGVTWTAYTDYTNAQNRAGQDFYVYAVARSEGSIPKLLVSANATYPINYTANTSRKIAGFHCLCNSVGTVAGNSLTGYVTGDILPLSVWDLHKKSQAVSGNVGQVYNSETGKWAGIYPVSGSKTAPTIVYGGTILVSTDWNDAVDAGKVAGMFLPSDAGFQSQAAGSNEQTVINGAALPTTAIGAVDSAGTRMISNIGCELCCGALDYWLDEQSYRFDAATAHTHAVTLTGEAGTFTSAVASANVAPAWGWQAASGSKGSIYKQGSYGDVKLTAGGKATGTAANAGSRGRDASNWRWATSTGIGVRLIANSIEK